MVSLYFNVFSSLSLSNLLPRVQLSNLLNNPNQNSFLNRFGIQDTVTDLLNRVGFDQTFSIGNKIGIDRPDSVLNKVELGMNNVINVNQQGLLNPGQSGVGGLYGGNGPGQFPGGGVSGVGTYGGQAGVSGGGGGFLGTQGGWQGQAQGSFPIGGGNRPAPPGAYPEGQFTGVPPEAAGGVGSSQAFNNAAGDESGNSGSGGLLSGIFSHFGNRLGWGSSVNKNDPKDYYKQSGGGLSWWMNKEDSHEYWLQEYLRDAFEDGRTVDSPSEVVLKYLVESQIKKLVSTLLQHLNDAKVRPEEQLKLNEAAQAELRKLTPEQIKRIAHDIVEREKSNLNELNRQTFRNPASSLSEDDLKQLLIESTKENEIRLDRNEIAQLLELAHGSRRHQNYETNQVVNKTTMSDVVQQLSQSSKPKPSSPRLENDMSQNSEEEVPDKKAVENEANGSNNNVSDAADQKSLLDTLKAGDNASPNSSLVVEKSPDTEGTSRPQLYISEQMRNNIHELLQQLAGHTHVHLKESLTTDNDGTSEEIMSTPVITTKMTRTATTTTTSTTKTPLITIKETNNATEINGSKDDDDVKALLQRLFGSTNDSSLKPFLPHQHGLNVHGKTSQTLRSPKGNLQSYARNRSFAKRLEKVATSDQLTARDLKRHSGQLVHHGARPSTKVMHSKENMHTSIRPKYLGSTEHSSSNDGSLNNDVPKSQSKKRELLLQPPPTGASRWLKTNLPKKSTLND